MKKLLLVLAAAFAMVACQTDLNEVNVESGLVDVTFEVGAPAARAYSDGYTATVLQYAVYEGTNELTDLTVTDGEIHGSTTVSFKLVTGNEYTVIFWAAAPNAPYTVDFANKTMTVDYTGAVCNAENRDAFYKRHTFTVTGAQTETIELKRPFAQLNIGTNDYDEATEAGYTPVNSAVKVTNVYKTLDLWDGAVTNAEEVTFDYAQIAKSEAFPVTGYQYLAMNYLLVPADKEVVDIEFGYTETDKNAAKTRIVGSVPVQRNYRTNIYGQLLTSDVDINVIIAPEYEEPAHELAALQNAALNGGTVTLTEDVVLTTPLQVLAAMTINLNGKTINNPAGYAIENYSKLTIEGNGDLNGMGAIRSHGGKVTINGGTFTGTSNWSNGTYQHLLKAVNTEVVINGGTFDATIGGTNNAMINVSENSVVTINGGTFKNVNGVIPQFAPYMFTYEKNGKLIINGGEFYGGWRFNGETATTDIHGGNFTVSYDGQSFHANSTHVLKIYGGTFSLENGGKLNPANHLAEGYAVVEKDGVYNVVAAANNAETLATAIAKGGLVVLTEDITLAETLTIENTTTTIDLNGKTLTAAETDGVVAKAGANVTISGNGKVISNGSPIRAIGGTVVVEGGEFTQTGAFNTAISTYRYSVDSREGGEIIIKGGEFKTNNGMINVSANSSVVVEGGSFLFDNNTKGTRHFAVVEGNITVNDGVFKGIADGGAGGCFFCGWGGTVTVNGGKFTSLWTSGSKNNIWESYYGGSIVVNGGIFNHNGGIKAQVTENTDAATKDAYPYMAK